MATVVGSITAYTPDENWQQYVERLLWLFMETNRVTDASKKRATFLSVVGPTTLQVLQSLITPANPSDKTFKELTEVLKTHFNLEPSEIVERYKFHTRLRRLGESVATYLSELRVLSVSYNFGPVLDDMLRDQVVCRINNDQMQKRLLSVPKLMLEKATKIVHSVESAVQNVRQLQNAQPMQESREGVHKVGSSPLHTREKSAITCYRSGKIGHQVQTQRCKVPQLW